MAKYSLEFKVKVVQSYLERQGGYLALGKQYNLSKTLVRTWVKAYTQFGLEGLSRRRKNKVYSVQEKLNAIELYLTTEMSIQDISNKIGLNSPSLFANWLSKYRKEGINGLSKAKGRPSKMVKQKSDTAQTKKKRSSGHQKSRRSHQRTRTRKLYATIGNRLFKRIAEIAGKETPTKKELTKVACNLQESFKIKDILTYMGLAKATFYHWKNRLNEQNPNQELINEIKEIFEENGEAVGYRYITKELHARGKNINHKKIQKLKKENGIQCVAFTRKSRKYNSYKGTVGKTAKNRIHRKFYTTIPHQKMTTDTTEFKYYVLDELGNTQVHKLYLNPFMDMFNSEILSYRISESPTAKAIMDGLNESIQITKDCPFRRTFHSDQGWCYQMQNYVERLKEERIFQSMSRKGNCLDNALMENFFSIMKQSMYYGQTFHSFQELKEAIEQFIWYYNNKRRKAKLGWVSPVDVRSNYVV